MVEKASGSVSSSFYGSTKLMQVYCLHCTNGVALCNFVYFVFHLIVKLEEKLVVNSSWHIYNSTFYCLFVRPLLFSSADTLIYSPMVGRGKTFYVNNPSHEINESYVYSRDFFNSNGKGGRESCSPVLLPFYQHS